MKTPISKMVDDSVAWNMKARELNTKTFINLFHREPKNYQEVHDWVQSLVDEADKQPLSKEAIEQYEALGIKHDGYKIISYDTNESPDEFFSKRRDYENA